MVVDDGVVGCVWCVGLGGVWTGFIVLGLVGFWVCCRGLSFVVVV